MSDEAGSPTSTAAPPSITDHPMPSSSSTSESTTTISVSTPTTTDGSAPVRTSLTSGLSFLDRLDEVQEFDETNAFRRVNLRVGIRDTGDQEAEEEGEETETDVPRGASVVARHDGSESERRSKLGEEEVEVPRGIQERVMEKSGEEEAYRRWTETMRQRAPSEDEERPTVKQALEARAYQVSLFERARKENIVACLPTGAGKTLISVKLLEHMAELERERTSSAMDTSSDAAVPTSTSARRVSLFLVNLVPLVHQQADVIATNSSLTVAKLFGQLDIDTWSEDQWQSMIRQGRYQVIVSTAQIVLDGLNRAFLKMRDVNLIVFDEAHHVCHSDPYARIMKAYRLATVEERPRIFGMTASPLKSGTSFEEAAAHLESTLDATLFTAPASSEEELSQAVAKPREMVIEYDPPRHDLDIEASQLTMLIRRECLHYEGIESVLTRVAYTADAHGTLMADLVWYSTTHELQHRAKQADRLQRLTEPELKLLKVDWTQAMEFGSLLPRSGETHEAHSNRLTAEAKVHRAVAALLKGVVLPEKLEVNPFNSTPKILTLVNILKCIFRNEVERSRFCGIIFVDRRQTAMALVELLKRIEDFKGFLKPEFLVGHGASGAQGMDWRVQQETLGRFRRDGGTNLLVATSVLEEGLDISPCNFVLRFDLFRHHISYVQSRGRARHRDSHFLVMIERQNESERRILAKVLYNAHCMAEWVKSLPEEKKAKDLEWELELGMGEGLAEVFSQVEDEGWADGASSLNLGDRDLVEEEDLDTTSSYEVPETGARLYPVDSVPLVWYYTITLATELEHVAAPAFEAEQENMLWRVTVKLPANSKLRCAVGPWCKTKKAAKRMAAFKVCVDLHLLGAITHHLVPHRRPKPAVVLPEKSRKLRRRDVEVTYEGKRPDALSRLPATWPAQVFATQLRCSALPDDVERRDLLLITRGALPTIPSFDLHFSAENLRKRLPGTTESFAVTLDAEMAEQCHAFTERLMRWVGRRAWTSRADDMPFFVLPLKKGVHRASSLDDVSWQEVLRGGVDARETVPLSESGLFDPQDPGDGIPAGLTDRILTEHGYALGASAYSVDAVRHDLDPWSPVPIDSPMREAKFGSFFGYLSAVTHKNRSKLNDVKKQPLLAVTKMGRMSNLWSTREQRYAKKVTEANFLIPQFLFVHCLSASVMRAVLLFPSLFSRIEQRCLAAELDAELFEGRIGEGLMDALTAPQSEALVDYERFEFIGDTLLKLIATCWVFSCCDTWDQSDLHDARKDLVCNAALLKRALELRLARFITSTGFTTLDWKPRGFVDPPKHLPRTLQPRGPTAKPINLAKRGLTLADVGKEDDHPNGPIVSDVIRHIVGEKTLADVVEAILGAATEKGGLELGLFAFRQLKLLPQPVAGMEQFSTMLSRQVQPKAQEGKWAERVSPEALRKLESHIEYSFKQPHVALEALIHPTLLASELPSYERLEFLGDAVLDYFVVNYLKETYPELDEGRLTMLKGTAVSNATLAAMAEVLGIHRYIQHSSPELGRVIDTYINEVRGARERSWEGKECVGLYWLGLDAPKAIADVVESLLGAVFVDAGFDLEPARGVFERMYLPFMAKHCKPDNAIIMSAGDLRAMIQALGCLSWSLDTTEVVLPTPPATGIQSLKPSKTRLAKEYTARISFHGRVLAEKTTRTSRGATELKCYKEVMDRVSRVGFDKAVEAVCDCARERKESGKEEEEEEEEEEDEEEIAARLEAEMGDEEVEGEHDLEGGTEGDAQGTMGEGGGSVDDVEMNE